MVTGSIRLSLPTLSSRTHTPDIPANQIKNAVAPAALGYAEPASGLVTPGRATATGPRPTQTSVNDSNATIPATPSSTPANPTEVWSIHRLQPIRMAGAWLVRGDMDFGYGKILKDWMQR